MIRVARMGRFASVALIALAVACSSWSRNVAAQSRSEVVTRPQDGEEINLAVGETKIVSAKDVKNFSEGVAGIIDIRLTSDNSQFVIHGRKPGSTTLLLIRSDGAQVTLHTNVFVRSPQQVERELTQLLEGIAGAHVRHVGARIVIDGTVRNEAELKRIAHVASLYPDQVEALATVEGGGATEAGATVPKYLIRVDFYFVQYDRNSSYGVGLAWPGAIGGDAIGKAQLDYDFLAGTVRTATASLTDQPIPRLDIASHKGWAKVLKQATVITNNGQEANFSSGGEQNFTVSTGLTVGLQRINFGTDVTVLPQYDPKSRDLEVKLGADVSDLTAASAGTTLPGRSTSKLSTRVRLKLGQSLVLSGIRSTSQTHTVSGVPFLSSIPILGLLFGSHGNAELETEGAIFIVPTVVETVPSSTSDLVDTAVANFKLYDGDIRKAAAFDSRPGGKLNVPPAKQ